MDRTEKLNYEKGIEKYFDDHKVYDLLEKLFKELIVNRPANPIDYMIERLKRKPVKRIFITGSGGDNYKSISMDLANELGYSCLVMGDEISKELSKKLETAPLIQKQVDQNLLIDDSIAIDLLRNQMINYEEKNESYIVNGFPRNLAQSIFLQQIGLLPDNVIILKAPREREEERIFQKLREKYPKPLPKENNEEKQQEEQSQESNEDKTKSDEQIKEMTKHAVEESELNIQAVQNVFAGFCTVIPVDKFSGDAEISEALKKLLKFKERSSGARRAPRIVLVAPPSVQKLNIVQKVAKQLQIVPVDMKELLRNEVNAKNENSRHILESLKNNELANDKYVLKLLEDRLYKSDCMINGWILTGFPKTKQQLNFLDSMRPEIKPSLLVLIQMDENLIYEKAEKLKLDPRTGRLFKEGGKKFNLLSAEEKRRLINRRQDEKNILKRRIETWKEIYGLMSKKNCLNLSGSEKKNKLAQLIVDAVGYNS